MWSDKLQPFIQTYIQNEGSKGCDLDDLQDSIISGQTNYTDVHI